MGHLSAALGVRGRALRPAPVRLVGAAALRERSLRAHASQPLAHLRAPVARPARRGTRVVRGRHWHDPRAASSIVQMSASDCNDLPSPMSSASKHPARSIATWGDGGCSPATRAKIRGWRGTSSAHLDAQRWGRSFLARNGSTTTATPRAPAPQAQRPAAVHNTSAPDALVIMQRPELRQRRPGERHGRASRARPRRRRRLLPWPTGVAKIAVGDTRFDASPTEARPPGRRHHRVRLCGRRSRGRGTRHRASPACAPRCVFPASEYFNIFNSG